jgi:hypothetical protein
MVNLGGIRDAVKAGVQSALAAGAKDDVIADRWQVVLTSNGYHATKTRSKDAGDHHILHFAPAKPGGRFEKVEVRVKRRAPSIAGIRLPTASRIEVQLIAFPTAGGAARLGLGGQKHVFHVDGDRYVDDRLRASPELDAQLLQWARAAGVVGRGP